MFDTITIKTNTPANPLDIGYLAECLLFYNKTNLLVDKESLPTLLRHCGVNEVQELIERGWLSIFSKDNLFGASQKGEFYSVDLFSALNVNVHYRLFFETFSSLYEGKQGKARRNARKFSKVTNSFVYDSSLIDDIENSLRDPGFTRQIISRLISEIGLEKEYIGKEWYYDFVPVNNHEFTHVTNLDLERFKIIAEKQKNYFDFSPGSLILDLAESFGDIQVALKNGSEIFTTPVNSTIIRLKFDNIFEKAKINHNTIRQFQKLTLPNYKDLASIINSGGKSFKDLIELIDKAEKFKAWKHELPSEADFVEEYSRALEKETWIDKLPTKIGRFFIFEAAGFLLDLYGAGGIGTAAATTLSAADAFILDKMLQNWKPNQFIKGHFKHFIENK